VKVEVVVDVPLPSGAKLKKGETHNVSDGVFKKYEKSFKKVVEKPAAKKK